MICRQAIITNKLRYKNLNGLRFRIIMFHILFKHITTEYKVLKCSFPSNLLYIKIVYIHQQMSDLTAKPKH